MNSRQWNRSSVGATQGARPRRTVPGLVVIDGGKGQLNAAYEALEEIGLSNLIAIGLAKQEELVFVRDSDQPPRAGSHARRSGCCSGSATRRTGLR